MDRLVLPVLAAVAVFVLLCAKDDLVARARHDCVAAASTGARP